MKLHSQHIIVGSVVAGSLVVAGLFALAKLPHAEEAAPAEDVAQVQTVTEPMAEVAQEEPEADSAEQAPEADTPAPKTPADFGLAIDEEFYADLAHGPKPNDVQKYIVLHDTEGGGIPEGVISYWESSGNGVAAHFVIGKDGHVVQCVPLDQIAHHAGFGDTGHNEYYGVTDESRDDKAGTQPIGSWAQDYGMNSYSIGIEMIHIGGEGAYPAAQLDALDKLIAYIDAVTGTKSTIIDHKMWRTGNSDTSPEFATYLANYQDHRTYE